MGGNIFDCRRIGRDEYLDMSARLCEALTAFHPGRAEPVQAYRAKPDFGDIDVLVERGTGVSGVDIAAKLADRLGDVTSVSHNGPVSSLLWRGVQCDLVFVQPDEYDFACAYFAWNDLGNLMGRVAHKMGFKYGHKGFLYPLRYGDYHVADILVSRDVDAVARFLGYEPERLRGGFDALEDVYIYAASTPYFHPVLYQLEHQSHHARVRDRKRAVYRGFLEWFGKRPDMSVYNWDTADRCGFLSQAFHVFPGFVEAYGASMQSHQRRRLVTRKFNGEMVMRVTGLSGRDLGNFIKSFRGSVPEFDSWVLRSTDEEVAERLRNYLSSFRQAYATS